jgi:outer membrane protein assembly factor BamA
VFGFDPPFVVLGGSIAGYYSIGSVTLASQFAFRRALIENPSDNWWALKFQSDMDTLGGDVGLRGYEEGSVGVYGDLRNERGALTGQQGLHPGNLSAQANLELRFPLVRELLIGDLYGAVFSDAGLIGVCDDLFTCEPFFTDERRFGISVGLGLRYVLPVGPITLDYAVSPIRAGGGPCGRQARVHFSFGFPF